jgi:hypothetical protein
MRKPDTGERDDRVQGELEERSTVLQHGSEFFQNEVAMLGSLLEQLAQVPRDSKVNRLIAEILRLDDLARQQRRAPEHILIFTEYRATQDLLVAALEEQFGKDCCTIIRGGMKLNEKRAAQRRFATDTRFLVSTEAGGEGINLHERSHILFNLDLPWNPMRIHQRIGRAHLAMALARAGRHSQAAAEAESLSVGKDATAVATYDAACTLALASSTAVNDDATLADRYAARAVVLLRQALLNGWTNVAHMLKDTDLDPLRRRADYADLLWGLADGLPPDPK